MKRRKIWYRLTLKDRKIVSILKNGGEKVNNFEYPVTNPKSEKRLSKLYIVKYKSKIVYVGITSQSLRDRLIGGLQAKGEHGYHGYDWKDKGEVEIYVHCYDKPMGWIEAVEAELVYLIKNETGKWPECQTEIHFHNATKEQIKEAKAIYGALD